MRNKQSVEYKKAHISTIFLNVFVFQFFHVNHKNVAKARPKKYIDFNWNLKNTIVYRPKNANENSPAKLFSPNLFNY